MHTLFQLMTMHTYIYSTSVVVVVTDADINAYKIA